MMDSLPNFMEPSGKVSLLPQYINSEAMYERFLNATLYEKDEIERAINTKGVKFIDQLETEFDNFDYFFRNKENLEDEFFEELCSSIKEEKATLFCSIISENWFDGRIERESLPVAKLMASIENYLVEYRRVKSRNDILVQYKVSDDIEINFEDDEVNEILNLNSRLLDVHIPNWFKGQTNYLNIASEGIYCRRGMYLKKLFDTEEYIERKDINSYSLAFSVTEKFSQLEPNSIPVIVNTPIENLRKRVLFFSPFIKNMPATQLELGVIPAYSSQRIMHQGIYGGIHEFLID